jgi:hypothetical protein
LKGQVAALVSAGRLSAGNGNRLQGTLDSAVRLLDGGYGTFVPSGLELGG